MALQRADRGLPAWILQGGVVTSLERKGSGGERIAVYLDGKFAFSLGAAVAASASLRKEEYLSTEDIELLLQQDEPDRARNLALDVLSHREMCAAEVAARLMRKGVSEPTVSVTIVWLQERGYVDDRRFAAAYATAKLRAGWGRQRIVSELARRGVARELLAGEAWIDLLEGADPQEERQRTTEAVRRRFAGQFRSDPEGAMRRIAGFLARRGHSWETISAILRTLKEDGGGAEDDTWQGP